MSEQATDRRSGVLFSLLSQAANSGGNLLLAVAVARQVGAADFGAWSIGYAAYMVALAVTRALTCTPLLLTRASGDDLRKISAGATSMGFALGMIGLLVLGAAGFALDDLRPALWAFTACLPVLLVQDVLRHTAFVAQRPRGAAVLDLSWLSLQMIGFIILEAAGASSVVAVTLVWGAAALPGVVYFLLRSLRRFPAGGWQFWQSTRSDGVKLLADSALATASTQALPVVVAAASGLAAAGALRGGLTLLGAINILVAGLTPVATLAARRQFDATGRLGRFVVQWSLAIAAVAVLNGAVLVLLPDDAGRALLGATWGSAAVLIAPLVLHSLVRGPFTGVPIALRASHRVASALRLRVWTVVPTVVLPYGGAILFGAPGAAWGIFLSALVANGMALLALRSAARKVA